MHLYAFKSSHSFLITNKVYIKKNLKILYLDLYKFPGFGQKFGFGRRIYQHNIR
jgi:hypothetical protein